MVYTATVTSKRQFTIPAKLFEKVNFEKGQRVVVEEEDGTLRIKKASDLVEELAGSVKMPKRLRGLSERILIEKAKEEYFKNKQI